MIENSDICSFVIRYITRVMNLIQMFYFLLPITQANTFVMSISVLKPGFLNQIYPGIHESILIFLGLAVIAKYSSLLN